MHSISHNVNVSIRHAMSDPDPAPESNDNNQIHISNAKIITNKNPLKT